MILLALLLGGCGWWERERDISGPDLSVTCETRIGNTTVNCRR